MQEEEQRASELRLIEGITQRDERAYAAASALHRASLLGWARRLASDAATAEDAVQEALLALWTHPPEARPEGSLRAWLVTTTRHALYRRRARDARALAEAEGPDLLALGADAGWGDPALGAKIEAALVRRDCLEHALTRLGLDDREVLALVDIEELSLDEAARALDLTLAATKSRLHRARLKLVAALRKEDCHEG